MLHAATCLAILRKVEDSSTFFATCNATFLGCYTGNCFRNLGCNVCCKLQEKSVASCNMALKEQYSSSPISHLFLLFSNYKLHFSSKSDYFWKIKWLTCQELRSIVMAVIVIYCAHLFYRFLEIKKGSFLEVKNGVFLTISLQFF